MFANSRTSPLTQPTGHHADDSFDDETGIDQSLAVGMSPASPLDSPPSQFAHRSQIEAPGTPLLMASTMSFLDRVKHAPATTPNRTDAPGSSTLGSIADRSEFEDVTLDMLSTSADRAARRSSTTPTRSPGARMPPLFPTFSSSPINRDSPLAAFTSGYLDSPHRLSTIPGSTTPSMALGSDDQHDVSYSSSLISMDFPVPPGDMSNLLGDITRPQTGMVDASESVASTAGPGGQDESRTTRGGEDTAREIAAPEGQEESNGQPSRLSSSFPYMSLESSTRSTSSCDEGRSASNNPFRTSTSTIQGDQSTRRQSSMSIASQNTITEAIGYYSQPSTPFTPPRNPSSSPADVTMYHTPAAAYHTRSGMPSSASAGDLTVYHTPRSANSFHFSSTHFNSPRNLPTPSPATKESSLLPLGPATPATFNPDASFARSIIEKGITPGQVGSPSLYAHFDYADSPSAAVALRHKLGGNEEVLLPALSPAEVVALNAEFHAAQQDLIESSRAKYTVQLEIQKELKAALGRRDEELVRLRKEVGEVRDLEVRLEGERRERESMTEGMQKEKDKREQVERELESVKERMERIEAESKDREIREAAKSQRAGSPEPSELQEGDLVAHLRDTLSVRELSLWELRAQLKTQQGDLDTARSDNTTLAQQLDSLSDQVTSLTQTNASIVDTIAEQDRSLAALTDKAQTLESEHVVPDASTTKVDQAEMDTLRSTIRDLEARLSDSSKSLANISASPTLLSPPTVVYSGPFAVVVAALTRDLTAASSKVSDLTFQATRDQAKIKEANAEMQFQWDQAEKHHDEIASLKKQTDQNAEEVERAQQDLTKVQEELDEVCRERDGLLDTQEALVEERDKAIAEKEEVEAAGGGEADAEAMRQMQVDLDYVEEDRDQIVAQRDEAWEERDQLQARLDETEGLEDEIAEINEVRQSYLPRPLIERSQLT